MDPLRLQIPSYHMCHDSAPQSYSAGLPTIKRHGRRTSGAKAAFLTTSLDIFVSDS